MAADVDETPIEIVRGSGNVFADLGLPDPEELQLKASLAIEVNEAIKARGLSRARVGTLLGLSGPEVTRLVRYRLDEVSVGQLMVFLTRLGHDVDVVIQSRRGLDQDEQAGKVSVHGLR